MIDVVSVSGYAREDALATLAHFGYYFFFFFWQTFGFLLDARYL